MEGEGLTTEAVIRRCRELGIDLGRTPKRMLEFWCEQRVLPYRARRSIGGRVLWAFPPSAEQCLSEIAAGRRKGLTMAQIAQRLRPVLHRGGDGPPRSGMEGAPAPARPRRAVGAPSSDSPSAAAAGRASAAHHVTPPRGRRPPEIARKRRDVPASRPPAAPAPGQAVPPPIASPEEGDLLRMVRDLWRGVTVSPERVRLAAMRLGLTPGEVIDRLEAARFMEIVLATTGRAARELNLEGLSEAMGGGR